MQEAVGAQKPCAARTSAHAAYVLKEAAKSESEC